MRKAINLLSMFMEDIRKSSGTPVAEWETKIIKLSIRKMLFWKDNSCRKLPDRICPPRDPKPEDRHQSG